MGVDKTINHLSKPQVVNGGKNYGDFIQSFRTAGVPSANVAVFIAPHDCELLGVTAAFGTASTSGTMTVKKAASAVLDANATAMLSDTMSLAGTAGTNVVGSLHATPSVRKFAAGSRIILTFGGALTNLVDLAVTLNLRYTE